MRKNIYLSILSGVLLVFSFPNFLQKTPSVVTFFFMWAAYSPLFYAVWTAGNRKNVFLYGMITGMVFYLSSLYWLCLVKPMGIWAYPGWIVLCFYFALMAAAPLVSAYYFKEKTGISFLLSIPVLMTFFEFAREWMFTGFPILTPAQSQHQFTFILQTLKITGAGGLNFMIFAVNAFIAYFLIKKKKKMNIAPKTADSIIFAAVFFIGLLSAAAGNFTGIKNYDTAKAAVLQNNVNQDTPFNNNYRKKAMDSFEELIKKESENNPDIYIWPETGFPGFLKYEKEQRKRIASWTPAFHLIGADNALFKNNEKKYYNSVFMMSPDAEIIGEYSKYHLVPFGEYIPLQNVFPVIRTVVRRYGYVGFSRGEKIMPLEFKGIKAAPIICYDGLFPGISREFVKSGGRFLAHVSYETWYGNTPASAQIFSNTLLRAVENNVYLIRCVSSGISGAVDNKGRIFKETGLFEKDSFTAEIKISRGKPGAFYTFAGEWFVWALIIVFLIYAALMRRKALKE
ncbi:MAG: apolipoprotein N-acyltransferase [Candidatus Goldiibacteriota bacterium]